MGHIAHTSDHTLIVRQGQVGALTFGWTSLDLMACFILEMMMEDSLGTLLIWFDSPPARSAGDGHAERLRSCNFDLKKDSS